MSTQTTLTAPAKWAPYLLRHDSSNLNDYEVRAANAFIQRVAKGYPVSGGFIASHTYGMHDAWTEYPTTEKVYHYTFDTGYKIESKPDADQLLRDAAPELLAALGTIEPNLPNDDSLNEFGAFAVVLTSGNIKMIRAAIKKAKGL